MSGGGGGGGGGCIDCTTAVLATGPGVTFQ